MNITNKHTNKRSPTTVKILIKKNNENVKFHMQQKMYLLVKLKILIPIWYRK